MATTKNLCAQIPIDLHERVSEERERLGQTTSEYIANLIQDYYNMMENQKGGIQMIEKGRTMAFQIPEELFQRIKRHLERETLRTGKKLTQRDFVLNLITQALDEADTENTPTEAPVAPRVADVTAPAGADTTHEDKAV
jgi:predicted DNA-binding protein